LEEVAAPVWKAENMSVGIRHADYGNIYPKKVGTNFADMW
jgi:hypothetical protein